MEVTMVSPSNAGGLPGRFRGRVATSWQRSIRALAFGGALALALCGPAAGAGTAKPPAPTAAAHALFDEYWEWQLREYPGFATHVGDHRYDDRMTDESPAAVARRKAFYPAFLRRLDRVDGDALSPGDRTSLAVLKYVVGQRIAVDRLYGAAPFAGPGGFAPVTQMHGIHLDLPELVTATRFASVADYENYLKRLRAVPATIGHLIERMQRALDAGWVLPRVAVERVPAQLDAQAHPDPEKSPEYAPFRAFPADVAPAERERLALAAREVIRDEVIPAFRSLKTFYETRYLPRARDSVGASLLPAGPAYYQAMVAQATSGNLTPKEIHEIGLAEVARIGARMDEVMRETGFAGTRAEFRQFLLTDPRFFYTDRDAMLAGYRDIAKRADAELPRLFATLPRQPYGIRAMRPEEGDNSEHYTSGAADGSRAGFFEANTNNLRTRPKWVMETLLLHEAVPGHHLQTARAQELADLPRFRRNLWFTAYGEGWALYAEGLGYEMGFYQDPYQKFGNLSLEMRRACRLVVDTGLHAFGWTRERAIDYMAANAGEARELEVAEVDRYIVWPGQATAYKVGELRIRALRARARAALGERFDLRRFHNVVIDSGAVPLAVLEANVDDWIVAERKAAKR
jgi:uncharacterized protein (DUF885 family)